MRTVYWNKTEVDDFIAGIEPGESSPIDNAEKLECPDCTRLVPELVNTSGVCWKCHVGSVQKGRLT